MQNFFWQELTSVCLVSTFQNARHLPSRKHPMTALWLTVTDYSTNRLHFQAAGLKLTPSCPELKTFLKTQLKRVPPESEPFSTTCNADDPVRHRSQPHTSFNVTKRSLLSHIPARLDSRRYHVLILHLLINR